MSREGEGGSRLGAERLAVGTVEDLLAWSPDAAFVLDAGRHVVANNARAEALFGYAGGELVGLWVGLLAPERLREAYLVEQPGVEPSQPVFASSMVALRKDGSELVVDVAAAPLRTDEKRLTWVAVRDVTAYRRAQEAVERLAAIVASTDDAVVAKDLRGIVTDWNPGAERLYGYTADEIVGRPVAVLVPPGRDDEVPGLLARIARGERVERYETARVRKDGSLVDVALTMSPIHGGAGEVVGASTIARDITERRQSERALQASEERFRELAEGASDLVYRYRLLPTPCFEYVSPSATTITGYTPAEHYADPDLGRKLVHPDDLHLLDEVAAGGRGGEPLVLRWRRKDGRIIWTEQLNVPVVDDGGRLVAINGIARDVTVRKEAEIALSAATEELRALDALKNAFLRTVSHDLRNPLTVIQGLAQTLEQRDADFRPEERRDLLTRIAANAERLSRMVSDLLDFDRLSQGTIEPQRVTTDVAVLVRDVIGDLDVGSHPLEVDTEPVVVAVDRTEVERIVENLVLNAVRHTPETTPIWVRVTAHEGGVLIVVADAGTGVPDDLKQEIFEPFRKGRAAGPGTGIGLSLVARFADVHGGRAWVEDRPGGGASFRVWLPAGEPDRQPDDAG